METLLVQLASALVLLSQSLTNTAVASPEIYIRSQAPLYGINPDVVVCIAKHESNFKEKATGDKGQSRGTFQISRIWHPEVSDVAAYSLEASTAWTLTRLTQGFAYEWTTYRNDCSHLPVKIPVRLL